MNTLHAQQALLPSGWHSNLRLTLANGVITSLQSDVAAAPSDERHAVLIPSMPNLHSHAFQRGMAGLTETASDHADSFWTWREQMYRFALTMTPDQVGAVAAQLYMEMLEAGFSRVGEFHYLHHAEDGRPYANIAEMAESIAAAADQTGIRLTLLPVFYAHSGFGALPPSEGQRRFVSSVDQYASLLEASRKAIANLPGANVGVAPHSLRAATLEQIRTVAELAGFAPIHMHIAEQVAEVQASQNFTGARPVEYLLNHLDVTDRWCLIHATHMTETETLRLAKAGAVAGLCPVTEANLGDGTFNAKAFQTAGGHFGIGSDSNVLIGIPDELRQLEYSQRIAHQARNVMAGDASKDRSTGRSLFEAALKGGQKALQGGEAGLTVGSAADFVSLDVGDAAHLHEDNILDGWIFGAACKVDCVWIGGTKRVAGGKHLSRTAISQRFRKVMQALSAGSAA